MVSVKPFKKVAKISNIELSKYKGLRLVKLSFSLREKFFLHKCENLKRLSLLIIAPFGNPVYPEVNIKLHGFLSAIFFNL